MTVACIGLHNVCIDIHYEIPKNWDINYDSNLQRITLLQKLTQKMEDQIDYYITMRLKNSDTKCKLTVDELERQESCHANIYKKKSSAKNIPN